MSVVTNLKLDSELDKWKNKLSFVDMAMANKYAMKVANDTAEERAIQKLWKMIPRIDTCITAAFFERTEYMTDEIKSFIERVTELLTEHLDCIDKLNENKGGYEMFLESNCDGFIERTKELLLAKELRTKGIAILKKEYPHLDTAMITNAWGKYRELLIQEGLLKYEGVNEVAKCPIIIKEYLDKNGIEKEKEKVLQDLKSVFKLKDSSAITYYSDWRANYMKYAVKDNKDHVADVGKKVERVVEVNNMVEVKDYVENKEGEVKLENVKEVVVAATVENKEVIVDDHIVTDLVKKKRGLRVVSKTMNLEGNFGKYYIDEAGLSIKTNDLIALINEDDVNALVNEIKEAWSFR